MTISDRQITNELEIQLQERIVELEKANQVLRAEILEYKQKERRMHRYNSILEGITRIFGSVVKAKTEEELGNACLSVAMEITGSQIGFVGEVDTDGLIHDTVISGTGWDKCLIYDKTGHRLPLENFDLRGLFSIVLDSETGFFTNDPASHPSGIGVPHGHPSLTSSLCVPLIQDGKIIGLIVVANREGGYTCEQQEDLEAIAPAVVQVLQRKKAEKKREQAEKALQESEEKSSYLIKHAPTCIYELDLNGQKFISVNDATCKKLGYTKEELLALNPFEMLDEESKEKFRERIRKNLAGERVDTSIEYVVLGKNGRKIWALLNTQLMYKDGKALEAFVIAHDITERKHAEEKLKKAHETLEEKVKARTAELEEAYRSLRESEKGLAEAQKMAHIGNWDWNLAADEMYWSDEMYRVFGHNPQKFCSSYNAVLSRTHPEDRDYVDNAVKKALKGETFDIDHRIILADGEERIVHAQGIVIFDEENNPIRMRGTVQDITERKQTEEKIKKLADAVESSDDAIITESLDGVITSWNKGAVQIYGYSAVEILGENASIFEPDNLKGEILQLIEKIRKREKIRHYRTLRLRKDGTIINVSLTLSPVFDASGELVAILAIARDITERIKAEESLAKIEDARKKEIHHRIKNNLQVISSLLDLQAEKFCYKKIAPTTEILEAFRESQNRVISMSLIHEELYRGKGDDTLDFSVYLQKLAENLFQTYSVKSKNIRLYMDLEENAFFDMDTAVPLGIIVNELISNSLKHAFAENQDGKIKIWLCREEKKFEIKESLFSLTISDNGKGIPEDLKLESTESLGLQLVGILVNQLNGEIEVKREHGTEFRINFKVEEKDHKSVIDK